MENNLYILGTVIVPIIGSIVALGFAKFNKIQRYIGVATSLIAWLASGVLLSQVYTIGVQTYELGGYRPPFGIVLVADTLGGLFTFMVTTVMVGGLIFNLHGKDKCMTYPAFTPLFLLMEAGLTGAMLTGDLFTLFVFVELTVFASVSLTAISDDPFGLEAALKYIFISSMGTVFLLLGIAAMYATLGTLNMAHMAELLSTGERPLLAPAAAIMLLCAFLLKGGVFPFHFWQPDFHMTAPTPVHAMLSSIVVKVGVYGIIRLITLLFTEEAVLLQGWLILLGAIGIVFGSLGALRTYDGKRMLAYSTFAQVGFILVGIGWGNPIALIGAIVYAFNHAFIKSAMLMLVGVVSSYAKIKTAKFTDISGIGQKIPAMTGWLFFLGGLALAGIPPLNGFISKLALIQGGIESEQWFSLIFIIGAGILTVMYTIRGWQNIFQRKPFEDTVETKPIGEGDSLLAPFLLITGCVLLGIVFAEPLVLLVTETVNQISDPSIYISAVGLDLGS